MSSTRSTDPLHDDTGKRSGAGRPLAYAALLTVAVFATFAYELRRDGIFACGADAYGEDAYLAYCNSSSYGDYDHGAVWFNFEPETRERAAAAQVLFLGSSRMEFAFSTVAAEQWFAAHGLTYYLLGFSHTENVVFVAPLLEMIEPRASAYVINVDGFFDDRPTDPAAAIQGGDDLQSRYHRKRVWQSVHRATCSALPALCGDRYAFFRARGTGTWTFHGTDSAVPGGIGDAPLEDRAVASRRIAIAEEFVAKLPVERGCIVFTVAPWAATPREEAETIAAALGVQLLAPRGEGLHTFDGSHLDDTSAEVWSRHFFMLAGGTIERCVQSSAAAAAVSSSVR